MGGFNKVAQSVMGEETPHNENCLNKDAADLVQKELDKYQEIMYDNFENAQSKEERIKYVDDACKAKFWAENMLENFNPGKCEGCLNLMHEYLMVPLYVICGVDERAERNKIDKTELSDVLKPLYEKVEVFEKQMETITQHLETLQNEFSDSDYSDSDE